MRENEVRVQVSGARSAQNEPGLMSIAVRQTPLTATLSPVRNSFGVCSAAIVIRRFSPRCSMRVMRPTSSTMPVNISNPLGEDNMLNQFTTESQRHREEQIMNWVSLCLCDSVVKKGSLV